MRRYSIVALVLGVLLLPIAFAVAVVDHRRAQDEVQRALNREADHNTSALDAYFLRARSIILLTANQAAFREFLEQPGSRPAKVRANGRNLREAVESLSYLERLYPNSIGEACFIDATGAEAARVVRGEVAPPSDLSTDENRTPFFAPTFALPVGRVYQARAYQSPDTKEWVIANATVVPTHDGRKRAIVHFEVTVESFRKAVAAEAISHVVVLDRATGRVVFDGDRPQRIGAPLGNPGDRSFARLAQTTAAGGSLSVDGHPAVFRRVQRATSNANDWVLVSVSRAGAPTLAASLPGLPLGIGIVALVALALGALGMRTERHELLVAAHTDTLTGLPNRRRLLSDLERHLARGSERPAVLLLFDLNGFKTYNDTFGHLAGDALLVRLGHALEGAVASHGRAYRLGGDEFCVLADAGKRAEVEALAALALTERGEGFEVTASYGAVQLPSEAGDVTTALTLADQRMYVAKRSGRASAERQTKDALLRALSERHPALGDHLGGVGELAEAVAARFGLDPETIADIRHAAELHDIGKVAIPDAILDKPGPLDEQEWAFMRRHTIIGERIVAAAPSLAAIAKVVRASHERWDGGGYPDGTAGNDIPLGARIVCVCDAYDAMTNDRPYSKAVTHEQALAEIRRCSGTQFDPGVVEAFVAVARERAAAASISPPRARPAAVAP